jgi:pSer/pThr/pTyr-binding forkhead associated (FHA) protein
MLKFQYVGSTKSVWLIGPVMKVGSSKTNELILTEEGIEPLHCYIHINQNQIEIEPIGNNEVYINEVLLKKKTPLKIGDITRIGSQEFTVSDPQNKVAPPIPVPQPVSSEATVFRVPVSVASPVVTEASGWMLQGLHKSLRNKRYPIDGTMYLGRSQECELHFSYERLSRKHAEFKVMDNVLIVKDLDSSNGTFVNGEKIKQAKLRGGDTIAFDKLEFTVIAPMGTGNEAMSADSLNQTVVRSALTPEMLKQANKSGSSSPSTETVASSSGQKKSSSSNLIMIAAGVVILLVVVAVMFLM